MATRIGERLREARSASGLHLEEIEARTKIRARFLRAMEEEDWEVLPGAAYVRGFLHTYAEALGLDADAVVAEYRSEEQPPEEAATPAVPETPIRPARGLGRPAVSRRRAWTLGAIALAAVLGGILALGLLGDSDEPERGAGKPAAEENASGRDQGGGGEVPAEPPAEPTRVSLRFTTTGTVWVCLVDDAGQRLVEGVTLPAGDEQGPFRARSFDLALGNGQIDMRANGERVPIPDAPNPLGYRITPERTRELAEAERPSCT
jgi:transcriptional regulator with XRE-family HTH domain